MAMASERKWKVRKATCSCYCQSVDRFSLAVYFTFESLIPSFTFIFIPSVICLSTATGGSRYLYIFYAVSFHF